ncbi:hypothetical protein QN277_024113 [Acacia crassicarpa]|uniref:F-box domain-containing protein n=1 Tax=Acacia crassicarpa TaxID=499986 RepID=A0AAE1JEJ7_9FABA|nr:hypothetical protein QN277_024113 [Acacia crassicarpa]
MEAEPRDLLSDLPDDILLHIFSFLQVKDILCLRILSTRFNKTLCTATPSFCFSDHYLHPHNCSCTHIFDFMFNTVPKNRPHALIINRVSFSCFCNKPEHRNLHKQWIIQLFKLKPSMFYELSLDYDLPSIFTSLPKFQSLKVLKLNMNQLHSVNMLPQMKLAALETLHIKSIYSLNGLLGEWISQSFPFLKHLFLQKIIIWAVKPDFTIRSSSLVDLVIHDLRSPIPVRIMAQNLRTLSCFIRERVHEYNTKFVLESCVPNLQSLTWVGRRVGVDLETLKNLQVTTNPRFLITRESKWDVLIQLFQAIRSARQLHIDTDVLRQWMRRTIMGILEESVSLKNLSHLQIDVVG